MGFNIKNNYGPNIEVKDGGRLTLVQGRDGLWHTTDAEEAEYEEVKEETAESRQSVDSPQKPYDNGKGDNNIPLSESRQAILDRLLALADKGDWMNGVTAEQIKEFLQTVLQQSEGLWKLLESGRGDRVAIVWQNIVGYLDEKGFLKLKGSPALNRDFFGNEKNYSNIDKGRPRNQDNGMSSGFRTILPLLDANLPQVDKKA